MVLTARNEPNLQRTSKLIAEAGGKSLVISAYLTDKNSLMKLVEKNLAEWNTIDILINNSGIVGPTKRCEEISREEWDECFAVNMTGVFLLTQSALPTMKKPLRQNHQRGLRHGKAAATGQRALLGGENGAYRIYPHHCLRGGRVRNHGKRDLPRPDRGPAYQACLRGNGSLWKYLIRRRYLYGARRSQAICPARGPRRHLCFSRLGRWGEYHRPGHQRLGRSYLVLGSPANKHRPCYARWLFASPPLLTS